MGHWTRVVMGNRSPNFLELQALDGLGLPASGCAASAPELRYVTQGGKN